MILQSHKILVADDKQRILPLKHQTKSWKNSEVNTYLNNRTEHSTRKISWKHLTLQLSCKVLSDCGFTQIQRSKLMYDKYANKQYYSESNTCHFCKVDRDTRAHLLKYEHIALVRIRELTNLHIDQLPLSKDIWESSIRTSYDALELRQVILQSVTADDRTRIGLFNPQQVYILCQHLSKFYTSNNSVRGIRHELTNLLQITARGIQQLIKCRNDEVYTQSKTKTRSQEHIPVKNKQSIDTNSRFRLFELEEVENIQMVTAIVYYHFPPIPTFPAKSLIDNERNGFHVVEGFRGSLYHSTDTYSNTIYEKFISSTIPSILWSEHSLSSPLQYNTLSKNSIYVSIHLS